jgi:aminopeptidase YwaD
MSLEWPIIDRWLMGEAWVNSRLTQHILHLCDVIGPRWASSPAEAQTVAYINEQMRAAGLVNVAAEEYTLHTWRLEHHQATVVGDSSRIAILPFNRCPACDVTGPLVDVGFGTPHWLEDAAKKLPGAIAVVNLGLEPFSPPVPMADRLRALADAGAIAAVVVDRKEGGRVEYHSAGDWRDPGPDIHPLPTVAVTREEGVRLRKLAAQDKHLHIAVNAEFYDAPAHNTSAELVGSAWPEQHIILGGHHDTVFGTPGGNDNASGTSVVMETARVLAELQAEMGIRPGCTLRFVTFSAEEQTLQGAAAYVAQHYGAPDGSQEVKPKLVINLDELSAGSIKGLVLSFPHLRKLVQRQFDSMGDGLQCHVMAQLDASSDHFPFLVAGIDASHLWRWRFVGRHADADFHHESGDTTDKVKVRELKEYVGQLARLLLRLSHIAPAEWPANPVTVAEVKERLEAERGQVIRVF